MSKPNPFDSQALVQLKKIDGNKIPATTSIQVAEVFGKDHKNVMQSIDALIESGKFSRLNFQPSTYKDSRGKIQRMYLMDETLNRVLVGRFLGDDALDWQIKYAEEFQRLRSIVQRQKGDSSAELNKVVNYILESQRAKEGKKTESWNYVNLACAVNREVFGETGCGKELRQQMTPEQQTKLNQTLTKKAKQILDAM